MSHTKIVALVRPITVHWWSDASIQNI